jgi:hypothetical protein
MMWCGAFGVLAVHAAAAHVAPSERENNRYVLLAPLADGVRLAYTVYMGQVPGRQARARMDRNRDGRLDDGEAQAFGDQLAAQAAPRLSLEVDGHRTAIEWQEVDVGLGEPVTTAGAFAVDMVAWVCLAEPQRRLAHGIVFRDSFQLPEPGESELRAEESPGVRITRSQLEGASGSPRERPRLHYRWTGGPGPAADGYQLEFEVDPAIATSAGGACAEPADGGGGRPGRGWLLAGALAAIALGGVAAARLRR